MILLARHQHYRSSGLLSWYQFFIGVVLFVLPPNANAFPSTLLTTTAAKCVQMDVGAELVVKVEYEAPEVARPDKEATDQRRKPFGGQDLTILVFQRDDGPNEWVDKTKPQKSKSGTRKVRMQLEQPKGDILFYTGNWAGVLEICRQSYKATPSNPRRLALNITKRAATVQERLKNYALSEQEGETVVPDDIQSSSILAVESSRISIELNHMIDKTKELTSHAEHSKDVGQDFYMKSIRLHSAVRFWPMFRMIVVMIAGLVQARLVVNYMKSRRIF